ncbi:hypothetical protein EDM57_04685 [Brevibacillus gelatini]|uniref:Uncharacterized protein n=1 Tax=Brevibacillus gelatini TaxID=1655277 RepID=A0A3M8B812_9BACL|nr:hypothetical protein [Brevibacillus gelatini]RNB59442.1 hypothetical protein EDM57_04685 [Brevibacillus gelatini]
MEEFLRFFNEIKHRTGRYTLEIYYSGIMDWCITINRHGETIVNVQNCDMDYVFAKAHVLFKEWLLETQGGY